MGIPAKTFRSDHTPTLRRVGMWCARYWIESREASIVALAAGDSQAFHRHRRDECDWFSALLIVNRLSLGIEPLDGKLFVLDLPQSAERELS